MSDPLAEVVTLLQPSARFSKVIVGAGSWRRCSDAGQPFYCVLLEGGCIARLGLQNAAHDAKARSARLSLLHDGFDFAQGELMFMFHVTGRRRTR